MTANDAIQHLTDEAERLGADANDNAGIVRAIVQDALAGRPDAQFSAWFCVCCELADRDARRQGFRNQVHRAFEQAKAKIAARTAEVTA